MLHDWRMARVAHQLELAHGRRHGGRTHFIGIRFLGEIIHGDVGPHIAAEINQDGIDPALRVEELGHPVVRLDLRRVRIELEPEALDEKSFAAHLDEPELPDVDLLTLLMMSRSNLVLHKDDRAIERMLKLNSNTLAT